MRIIRTEMYFDDVSLRLHRPAGVSVAWIGGDFDVQAARQSLRPERSGRATTVSINPLSSIRVERVAEELRGVISRPFLEFRISMVSDEHPRLEREIADRVDFVLQQPIVVEQSPPTHITLDDVVRAAKEKSPTVLGAFVGYVTGEGAFLLITVPLGMLVVSSAAGISRALDEGLYELLKSWLKKS